MATRVAAAGGGNFTTGATWVGGIAPTAADDAQLDATSGNVTIDSGSVCRSLDCTGYTGTLTHTSAVTLTIGDGTAGASNIALKLVSGMTYAPAADTCSITFASTSGTQQTIDTGGKSMGNIIFAGAGSSYLFSTALTQRAATTTLTHTNGTVNTNGQNISIGGYSSSNTNVRALTLGASAVTVTGTSIAWVVTNTNITFTPNTSVITFTGVGANVYATGTGFNTVVFTATNGLTVNNFITANLTITGTASKTFIFALSNNLTVTGTFTIAGNSVINRVLFYSSTLGTARTITNTGATQVWSNVDFKDITLTTAYDASAITGGSGDCGGNTNITFTTAATQTYSGTLGSNWSANAWTTRVPLPQDDVVISSAFAGSQTIVQDMPRMGKSITFLGSTGTPTWNINSVSQQMYGSLTLISDMLVTGTQALTLEGRGTFTITTAGKTITAPTVIQGVGGTYTLQDAYTTSSTFAFNNGTFNANGFNVSATTISSSGSATRTLTMGSGTWTATSTGTVWNFASGGMTLNQGSSTISLSDTGASTKTFAGAGLTYHNISIAGGGAGAVIFTGANSFNSLTISGGTKSITLPGSTTTTIRTGVGLGNSTNLITFTASAGSATVSLSATTEWDYVSLTNIPATGTVPAYAGANSTDGTGNTNWLFTAAPATGDSEAGGGSGSGGGGRKPIVLNMRPFRRRWIKI